MTRWLVVTSSAAAVVVGLAGAGSVHADAERMKRARPWAKVGGPSTGPARAIGKYKGGCLQGGRRLPLDGPGFVVVRPERKRNFGHPSLIAFIKKLGAQVNEAGLGHLPISDLGQARGGPTPSGHASHQIGLDVDIWFGRPRLPNGRTLTFAERQRIYPATIVSAKAKGPTKAWSPRALQLLRLAAADARVARIFINPLIKAEACKSVKGDRTWLRKLRPWWGHSAHFHVRLHCPKDSPGCRGQSAIPPGDGCKELEWWTNVKKRKARTTGRKTYRKHIRKMPTLPEECEKVLK